MKKLFIYCIVFFILFLVGCISGNKIKTRTIPEDKILTLQWNKAYEKDSLKKALTGLEWALSHTGAKYTQSLYQMVVTDKKVTLNIVPLGFNKVAQESLMVLHHKLKATEEYQQIGAIDMGRYATLLVGASEHYYKLVRMPDNYFDLLAQYKLTEAKGYVNNSSISKKSRIISFSEQKELNQLFIAEETDEKTGKILEYETMDIMSNGQLRFGVFDVTGKRKNNASPSDTKAGKPGKCMWCHESRIQPLFDDQIDFEGYLTAQKLTDTLDYYNKSLMEAQEQLIGGVNYSRKQDHAYMEKLYIAFMEPSAERLSLEWGVSLSEVENRLSGLTTHIHHEFGDILGPTYFRTDVEKLAPYKSLTISSNVREQSNIEVNHME